MNVSATLQEDNYKNYLLVVANATLEDGGTASMLESCQFLPPVDLWSFPKYPEKTAILPPESNLAEELAEFVMENRKYLREDGCWLGTWVNPQTGDIYVDIATGVEELEAACQAAIAISLKAGRNIVAMYNSKREQTVFL